MSPSTAFRRTACLAAILFFLAAAPAGAQQQFTLNFRDTDLRQVIETVGELTGRNFLPDPRVRGTVTLISNTPMSLDSVYEAFLTMLSINGFVTIDDGEFTRIVADQTARQLPSPTSAAEREALVTQVVRVENVGATTLVPILRPMQAQYAHLTAIPNSNLLVIVDRKANVDRLIEVIDAVDREMVEDVEVIRLNHAFAGEVVQTLGAVAQASAAAAGGAPGVQIVADERTNSVLLSGTETSRLRYRALVAYLDEPVEGGGDTRVRYLNYADAEVLATQLQQQFGGGAGAAAPAGANGPQPAEGPVSIWADAPTNALVISAPSRIMQSMMAIIDQIDIPRAQVLVEAIFVEVSEEKAAELGVTWIVDGSDSDDAVGLTNFGATTRGVVQLGAAAQGDQPSAAAIPDGALIGVGRIRDTGTSWAALVSALRGDGSTNIIATPHVTVLDNDEAEISVGQEVPFLTGSFTATGTSDGAINPFQTIQREPVGTSLRITPQVNEGDGMKLTIEVEQSSINFGAGGAVDLITNNRTISTSVAARDGEILVLGGLIDDQLRESEQRVPGLGRIPGLGWLFRARSTERVKTNLMVFIRPTILRDSVQAGFQTSRKYNYIREMQRQQAERPVQLMRGEQRPMLPELEPPSSDGDGVEERPEERNPEDGD